MGVVYQHYKGAYYLGLGEAQHSEDESRYEAYFSLYPGQKNQLWIRPATMFHGLLEDDVTRRFSPKYQVRPSSIDEEAEVLGFGHDAWGEGRSLTDFLQSYEQSRFYQQSRRFLLSDLNGNALSKMNLIPFTPHLSGIASVATRPQQRGRGLASLLLTAVMTLEEWRLPGMKWLLFSEVGEEMYRRLGFRRLPEDLQKFLPTVAMVRSAEPLRPSELSYLSHSF